MAEVKRYEFIGGEMRERPPGWSGGMVFDHDYTALEREAAESRRAFERAEADVQALEREVERLRKIEQAAIAVLDAYNGPSPGLVYAVVDLERACGRKGWTP